MGDINSTQDKLVKQTNKNPKHQKTICVPRVGTHGDASQKPPITQCGVNEAS